jgi:YfiR/HmsC-like
MALLMPPRLRLLIAAVTCLHATTVFAQPAAPIEASVKAVFLFNFAKYVTWPVTGIGERSPAEVRICVTANDEFFSLLKAAVEGEAIDGKPLVPVALDGLDDAKTCQILYVGDSRSPDAKAWLSVVRAAQVLTVADGALNNETVIAFVRDDNRIRFDINRAAADRRNLNVSAKLLRLARTVRDR